jgi:hypothetical protein
MALERYFLPTAVFVIGCLLALAETRAQEKQPNETTVQPLRHAESNSNDRFHGTVDLMAPASVTLTPSVVPGLTEKETGAAEPESNPRSVVSPPALLHFEHPAKLSPLDGAYLDAYSLLREDSDCSRFYGGPPAIEALNRLTRQIKPTYLDRPIALRMNGKTSLGFNHSSGFSYRIFERVELNLNGPFYKSFVPFKDKSEIRIGAFAPNTREARVTILLHELGHLVKTESGWLLANDGDQPGISEQNTERVIAVCGEQIKGLKRQNFVQELQNALLPLGSKSPVLANALPAAP